MSRKLTKALIDKASYEGSNNARFILWDSELAGFGLRLYPSGKKSFVLQYRFNGQRKLITLGYYGALTLHTARDIARVKLTCAIQGNDPLAEKKRLNQGETVGDLCEYYLERHAKNHKKSWRDDEQRIKGKIIPAFGARRIRDINRAHIAVFHSKLGKDTPYEANRVLALLSVMFGLAKHWVFLVLVVCSPGLPI